MEIRSALEYARPYTCLSVGLHEVAMFKPSSKMDLNDERQLKATCPVVQPTQRCNTTSLSSEEINLIRKMSELVSTQRAPE